MTRHTKENMSEEMREFYRSLLLKEVKDRIRMLKEYGMAERDIISALFHEKSLPRYSKVRPWGLSDRAIRSIEDVTNPVLNSINEKCARIRKAFLNVLDDSTAEQYYIKGTRGGVKKVSLPRDSITWE